MLNFIVVIAALTQGIIGLLLLQKKRNSFTNISFVVLSFASMVWAIVNFYYTLNPTSNNAFLLIRVIMLLVVIQNTAFCIFATSYPSHNLGINKKSLYYLLLFSSVVTVVTFLPLVFQSASIVDNQTVPNPGPLIPLFIIHALITISLGLRSLFKKKNKFKGLARRQASLILIASMLNWVLVPITNFVFTLVFKTSFFAKVSPIYTLIFSSIIAYAIIAHKLFDIRAVVARSVAYVGAIAAIVFVYTQLTIIITGVTIFSTDITLQQQIINISLAIIAAIAFKPIKKIFDKITNKIFYRDAYDTQLLIDELNNVLVNTPDLTNILNNASQIIQERMKVSECTIYVRETSYFPDRAFGFREKKEKLIDVDELNKLTKELKKTVFSIESDADDPSNSELDKLLHDNNYEILVRLVDNPKISVAGVGYLLLGPKSSGSVYNSQDIKMLEIIANELVIAVENALRLEEIEQFNVTLQKKIDGATKELKSSNKKLRALDEAKDEFVSMASHQLRTPLTSIKGYLSMVLDGDAGKISSEQKDMLGQAFFSSQRMVYLIADLLNVSRLKTGKFVIERKPIKLPYVIETELNQLTEGIASKGLELDFKKPDEFPEINVDEMKIRQVIMNFLDNAIYYTPKGGKITIELKNDDKSVEARIKDSGIGVPKKDQSKLFTKFYRADNARKARPDGTGLGLFMAKKVIEAHSGKIIFESEEGKGSTFGFSLPIKQEEGES